MKPVVIYSMVILVSYLVFLILLFPAQHAWGMFQPTLTKHYPDLQVAGIHGTVWRGRAASVVYRGQQLGELQWRLNALPLLGRKLSSRLVVQNDQGYAQGRLSAGFGANNLRLQKLEARLPIEQISHFLDFKLASLDGMVSLQIPYAEFQANGLPSAVQGTIVWHQAVISITQAAPLGDLRIELHTDEQGLIHAAIRDNGIGPLKIDARWQLSRDGRYQLQGTVAAQENASDSLRQALVWLGNPDSEGNYRLQFSGKLG